MRARDLALVLAAALVGGAAAPVPAPALSEAETLEYRVKAGFLYNFLNFVSWPDAVTSSDASWQIGIVDDGRAFDLVAASLEGKRAGGRPIAVTALAADSSPDGLHVVFVTRHAPQDPAGLLARMRQRPILVLGETPDFARRGGVIGFVARGANLRLEINIARARDAGLVISSRLASLAEIVHSDP